MLTLLNRMGNSLFAKLGEKKEEQIILPFNQVERRGDGLYYDTSEETPYTGAIRRWRSEQEISDHVEFRNGVLPFASRSSPHKTEAAVRGPLRMRPKERFGKQMVLRWSSILAHRAQAGTKARAANPMVS